ncbi:hypothetical protein PsorP6_008940 [Peronosclerospora sorghi]|uniref:Uncharacterized protein n=1 Tax=Peronosclerospora sorghi TaxID=230839 RepID=A0ACC0W074_9STRA|nr:hypothetical protein PsorP6_008940 [Peronosclerospora sorghi]
MRIQLHQCIPGVPKDLRRLGSCCSIRILGNVLGVQPEYVRVPYADIISFKLPSGVSDEKALLEVETTGKYVVVWGLCPIGLQAAHWCMLRGVEFCSERLKFAHNPMNLEVVNRDDLSSARLVSKLQHMLLLMRKLMRLAARKNDRDGEAARAD